MALSEVKVPDIGDCKDVPIIEVHVTPGTSINVDDTLITLESDKATMEVPTDQAGTVEAVLVKVGDRVSQGTPLLQLKAANGAAAANGATNGANGRAAPVPQASTPRMPAGS